MPRYFFDYLNHPDLCDGVGVILPNDAAARQEALARAHDARSTHSLISFRETDEIVVRKDQDAPFYKVRVK